MRERIIASENLNTFREYLLREEKSEATIEKYLRDVRAFGNFAEGREVTRELTISYKNRLQEQKYAVRSINSMLASVNSFFKFMGWQECRVKSLKYQRQIYSAEKKELSKEEYMRLLNAAKGQEQLQMILQTICATGIRVSELKHFSIEAIRQGEVIVHCKNKTRTILIPGKLRKILMDFAKRKGIERGTVFITRSGKPIDRSNIWAKMKRLCQAAKVEATKVFPHNLRKLFAKTFYGMEKDIAKLADILGHGSIETTRIYIMTTGTEHRRKIERLGLVM